MNARSSVFVRGLILLSCCAAARADVLVLDDGSRLEGKARKDGSHWVVTDSAGHQTTVDQDRITSFELDGGRGKNAPARRLAVLHETVDNLSDITQILARYDTFIQTTAPGDALDQAKTERRNWARQLQEGDIKVSGRWLSPDQQSAAFAHQAQQGQQIIAQITDGKTAAAQDALKQALAEDPRNPTALYLSSYLAAQAGQYDLARQQLETAIKLAPTAPALNNLAVILWHQHFYGGALADYVQAMTADPVNKAVLDNVAEAMAALPPENSQSLPAQQAAALFARQEPPLERRQAAAGESRWGARWVSTDRIGRLEVEEQTVQGQLSEIASAAQDTQASIASDDAQIQSTQQAINNAANMTPLPINYYQLQQDLALLQQARQVGVNNLHDLQVKADKLQHSYSTPKYLGQQLIGPAGAPIRTVAPQPPATRPAG